MRRNESVGIDTNLAGFYNEQRERLAAIDHRMRHTIYYTSRSIVSQGRRPECKSKPALAPVASRPTPSERAYAPVPPPVPPPDYAESPLVAATAAELIALVKALVPERDADLKISRARAREAARQARAQQRRAQEEQQEDLARAEREIMRAQWRAARREQPRPVRWQ